MGITHRRLDRTLKVPQRLSIGLISAVSQTDVPFFFHTPGHDFEISEIEMVASLYAAVLSMDAAVVGSTDLITKGSLAIDATAEKFKTTAITWAVVNGVLVRKAAATAIVFTAGHIVTASLFGIIRIQMNASGTVSTKVPSATQAYASAALALAALPDPDADNVAIGYIAIANNAGDWVANTDDLTDGSDLTTATFVDAAEPVTAFTTANPAFITGSKKPALSLTGADLRGGATSSIVLLYTSDGSGALTNARVNLLYRPLGMAGDSGVELTSRS